ncbi:ABC transporter permease [Salinivibrio costicola]|uniref:FtsX-like permease family protein n=1 Tax=Salinivibrio costicola TaxID=51367 RepID=A0ABX6K667_SALCS|nr:ABC transporter permease [Salinivibrio costicola]QIR07023.1 FtsX-like permease family protein [Salinivibrio costicola]
MISLLGLAGQSLKNRRATALLSLLTVTIAVVLLLGVEKVRTQAKASFANTISNTDLIVGARSGPINLLLYSVFRIGNATNNIGWDSYQRLGEHPDVSWTIPISLGDSHRGFRVVGTSNDYFDHYQYGQKQPLAFRQGGPFFGLFNTVIGAQVAKELGYKMGDSLVIAHGLADKGFNQHDNLPFTVTGILAPTGTPVDRSVHVSLEAIEAIHVGWESGARLGQGLTQAQAQQRELQPEQLTAVMVGLKSKIKTFAVQRWVNTYPREPLTAIMPGIALHELWDMMRVGEQALLVISGFVAVAGLLGMLSSLLTSLNERRREMAILRAMGARPLHIILLLVSEAVAITLAGIVVGVLLLYGGLALAQPYILSEFGLFLPLDWPSSYELSLMAGVLIAGFIVGLIPAWRAYRQALADGMTIKV